MNFRNDPKERIKRRHPALTDIVNAVNAAAEVVGYTTLKDFLWSINHKFANNKVIESRKYISENIKSQEGWRAGPDMDWPNYYRRSERQKPAMVPVLDSSDSYEIESVGTHGGLSHMIKHLHEWDESIVDNLAEQIRELFAALLTPEGKTLTLRTKSGETHTVESVDDLKKGVFITYLDYINDKLISDGYSELSVFEKEVLEVASSEYYIYNALGEELENKAVDVSDKAFPDIEVLAEFLETGPTIEYEEHRKISDKMTIKRKCVMDLSTGWFVGYDSVDGSANLLTIFQMQKQAKKGIYKTLLLLSPTKRSANRKKQKYTHTKNKSQLTKDYTNLRILSMIANDKRGFISAAQAAKDKKNSKMKKPIPVTKGTEDLKNIKLKRKKRK